MEAVTYGGLLGQLIYMWKSYFCYEPTMPILGADAGTAPNSGVALSRANQGLRPQARQTLQWSPKLGNQETLTPRFDEAPPGPWRSEENVDNHSRFPVKLTLFHSQDNSLFSLSNFPIQKFTVTGF